MGWGFLVGVVAGGVAAFCGLAALLGFAEGLRTRRVDRAGLLYSGAMAYLSLSIALALVSYFAFRGYLL